MADRIIEHLLRVEGWPAYTDNPADRGGPTKGGITLETLRSWRYPEEVTVGHLRALQQPEAENIYRALFIDRPHFDLIGDELLRLQVVDAGVMSGPSRAVAWLQDAAGVDADGVFGPKTAVAVNAADPHRLALLFAGNRIRFLGRLIERDRTQAHWSAGWFNRATSFLTMEAARG